MVAEFEKRFGATASVKTYFCPGRVNLIGEHIDYNGGLVLPAAISFGTTLYLSPRNDGAFHIQSVGFDGEVVVALTEPLVNKPEYGWAAYVVGCIALLQQKGIALSGYNMLFESNLPIGSGLSSSASVEVLSLYALLAESGISTYGNAEIAIMAKEVENHFVGVNCGIMDQFAVAMGKAGHAIKLNCETLSYSYIPARFGNYVLVIINTNKPRKLVHSAYNTRLAECQEALRIINQNHSYTNLCEVPLYIAETELANDTLLRRARHCITEQQRVQHACLAMETGDMELLAKQLIGSHLSLRTDYEVTGTEPDALFDLAMSHTGCIAARITGAGFGGCVIALVQPGDLEEFKSYIGKNYEMKTGFRADFYPCEIVNGVSPM